MRTPDLDIRNYRPGDRNAVVDLWRRCGLVVPWNDPHTDIDRKLRVNPEWFLVGETGGTIIATVMAGYEGHRGWINYLAVDPALRRRGIGRAMMARAEEVLRRVGCPKINLQVRTNNVDVIEFYRAAGFSIDDVVSMGKRFE